jgi:5-methyltetrahydropteroyltriglutamate--homocysteine methyltransferase
LRSSTDRILTTHVGSLIRTREIIQGMKARALNQPLDERRFAGQVRQGVIAVVKQQVDLGIDIPSDGEYGRAGFLSYISERLDGLEPRELGGGEDVWADNGSPERQEFPEFFRQYDSHYRNLWMLPGITLDDMPNVPGNAERFRVTGPVHYKGQAALRREIDIFREALDAANATEGFMCATQPGSRRGDTGVLDHYASEDDYLEALADAFHEEYTAIADAGLILQIDYPLMHAPRLLTESRTPNEAEIRKSATRMIEAVNHALRGIPEDRVRVHHCWGSMNDPHTKDVPLREIVDDILAINAQAYSIEAANARHEHEWMVWKDVKLPEGKILIPGVVSHQTNVVEHPDLVCWRICNFAAVVGRENVIAGTDCGFSQFWDSIRVHPEVQWAKLGSLVEGARLASKKLWS